MARASRLWIASLVAGLAACAAKAPPGPPPILAGRPPPVAAVPETCRRFQALEVRKSERLLVGACAEGGELRFPVALARSPGAKRVRGDLRMPEGEYRIAGPARPSRFHRFIPIDYPSPRDAERGLAAGRISLAERDAIARAHAAGRLPPQDTALGGHLGLHGEGRRWRGDLALDWTEGCVALADDAIELVAERVRRGTPVRIVP
jgi:murein L,D-transpeptidase YafK